MEFLRGQGLEAVVRRGPVSGQEAARWGAQICDALAEAHAGGILHRDIKPANVFVTASGGVKVLDFGIARAADPTGTGDLLTRTGAVASSHERLFGQWGHVRVLDARTGREVWAGDFATTFATDPTAGGDLVFVADKDGKLSALRI